MLTLTSHMHSESPEETAIDLLLVTEPDDGAATSWTGHPFRLKTAMRDGTMVSFAFTLTECAEILLLLSNDARVRTWLEFRAPALVGSTTLN